jgi:8-oxo-dGTP pyrophosphatase MutT (NUDIX family)
MSGVAIMQDGRFLLAQRKDFETRALLSGRVDEGESLAQAAIRDAKEETGIDVAGFRFEEFPAPRSIAIIPSHTGFQISQQQVEGAFNGQYCRQCGCDPG